MRAEKRQLQSLYYILKNGQEITICPSCLAFSGDETAKIARQAHKEGLLVKEAGKR